MEFFDDTSEQEKQEQKLYEFYQVFSAEVRRKLLSRNVAVIHNVYDVLYPKTKENLLSKNTPTNITIDTNADSIRNALISKLVEENIDLEKFSESFRKSLLSRNDLVNSTFELDAKVEKIRKNLLTKNKPNDNISLDNIAEQQRNNLLSKNAEKLGTEDNIENNNISYRENNIHKNVESKTDLEKDSIDIRKNNTHKNVQTTNDLLSDSEDYRKNNIHKNLDTNGTEDDDVIDKLAKQQRFDANVKNNIEKIEIKLDEYSEDFRVNNITKNVNNESSIENDSEEFRRNNVNKNVNTEGDLLQDSSVFRKEDISKNVISTTDLLVDSEGERQDDLSKNVLSTSDLLEDSEIAKENNISKNVLSTSDLLDDSDGARKDNLSKNVLSTSDLLTDSDITRKDDLSKNVLSTSDLLIDSEDARKDDLSKNVLSTSDLLDDSELIRKDDLSKNVLSTSDLLVDSEGARKDDLSKNVLSVSDLLTDSESARQDDLSKNVLSTSDLLIDSQAPREGLLAANVPNPSDLLSDSQAPREGLLAANVPNPSDLLSDSQAPREGLLATNVPNLNNIDNFVNNIGMQDSAQGTLSSLLASNPDNPNNIDSFINNIGIQDSAQGALNSLISSNVDNPNNIDSFVNNVGIQDTAQGALNSLLASNPDNPNNIDSFVNNVGIQDSAQGTLNSLLVSNPDNPNNIDSFINNIGIQDSAQGTLESLLVSNVNNQNNIDNFVNNFGAQDTSQGTLESLQAKNVTINSDLLSDSQSYRDDLLSKNNGNLGVTFEGLGTATYLGVSKVLTQGLIIRSFLKSKNRPNRNMDFDKVNFGIREYSLKDNDYILGNSEYNRSTAIGLTNNVDSEGKPLVGYFDRPVSDEVKKMFQSINSYSRIYAADLQLKYGNTILGKETSRTSKIGGGFFGVDVLNPQGGEFVSYGSAPSTDIYKTSFNGSITDAIRNYNLSRNLYNMSSIQAATSTSSYIEQIKSNNDLGFQDLINRTIGSFHNANNSIGTQTQGSATPRGVLTANNFMYFKVAAERLLRPNEPTDPSMAAQWINNPESMMAKTVAGNIFDDREFKYGDRGVKHIMKTIRNNKNVDFSINYDPQNSRKYIIGRKDNEIKFARQRFTIANPYSAPTSKPLIFSLRNYSSGDAFYFPPYIATFQDSHTANWNEINFLGRPEPIFTYNNSNRDGSITFFVLTDYTQNFMIGRNYGSDAVDPITMKIKKHFSYANNFDNEIDKLSKGNAEKEFSKNKKKLEEIEKQKQVSNTNSNNVSTGSTAGQSINNSSESSNSQQDEEDLKKQNNNISAQQNNDNIAGNSGVEYNNSNSKTSNIYTFMTSESGRESGGDIESKAMDTEKRLKEMISGLMFQPAYFSGDKVDFVTRMEFLAKLTKPARSQEGSGFSFTQPPVAHIKLGDWWDHDIVVKSVGVDYASAPWTLDEGRVQPMWASITLQFNFVGPHGGESSPVVSTDIGGIYSPRVGIKGQDLDTSEN